MVNQDEAQTVKVIYYLYLNGFSLKDIAELLTDYERKTKLGNTEWNRARRRHLANELPLWGCAGEKDFHTKLPYAQGKEEQQ